MHSSNELQLGTLKITQLSVKLQIDLGSKKGRATWALLIHALYGNNKSACLCRMLRTKVSRFTLESLDNV